MAKPGLSQASRELYGRTKLDLGILRQKNVLSFDVSMDHMMGVKMSQSLRRDSQKNKCDEITHHICIRVHK